MNYHETIEFLYSQLPMFQRVGPAAFKKDLTNILALVEYLGQPHEKFQSIHIAGTNGKGTVSHFLASIFQSAGYKTGLYTSPHYRDFRERIRINGQMITEAAVISFVERIMPQLKKMHPSFFEITVAMAFDYFAGEGIDVAIIETGLGGRLDSTNIVHPRLSVITNISFDHQSFLGDTLQEIAGEKAGIIKKNVPVVIGELQPEIQSVFEKVSNKMEAPLYFANKLFQLLSSQLEHNFKTITYQNIRTGVVTKYQSTVLSPFVERNLLTVLGSVEVWNSNYPEFRITPDSLYQGVAGMVENTSFTGRWQRISERPPVIADSAHNEAGLRDTLHYLSELGCKRIRFVLGFVNDKDWKKLLTLFPKDAIYYFTKADIPRGLDANVLKSFGDEIGLKSTVHKTVPLAVEAAKLEVNEGELIFVGGSSFVVAEVV